MAMVYTPIIRSATRLDAGSYGTVVYSLMLSSILPIDNSCVLPIMFTRLVLCRPPGRFKRFDCLRFEAQRPCIYRASVAIHDDAHIFSPSGRCNRNETVYFDMVPFEILARPPVHVLLVR